MKSILIALVAFAAPLCLNAQTPSRLTPKPPEIKWETRDFRPGELQDVKLDMYDGGLSFTVAMTTYTYQPNFDSVPAKLAASATLLAELRHATRLLVKVEVPTTNHVFSQFFVLQFDSLK